MNIIFLGPPGAGKGTQGELLARDLSLPRLSTGAILRRVWREGGETSKEIGKYILKGINVPAKLLFKVLEPWFLEHHQGFIADNFPRSIDQLEEFKKFLKRTNLKIDKAFLLEISKEESFKRIDKRFAERKKTGNTRPDERPDIVERKLREGYQKDIKPILDFFNLLGILVVINGEQSIEKVHQDILNNIKLK
ncbi:MAG: nucleoside monophosphate kinase [Candidatus Gottesmanbacteria bacterium]